MGSFVELTLAFTFSRSTPLELIGAFVKWRVPEEEHGTPAPELQVLDIDVVAASELMDRDAEQLAPADQAALWNYLMGDWGNNAYFPGTPSTQLRWDPYAARWSLTVRTLPKESPSWVQRAIAPLGRWACEGTPERPWFAGYLLDEYVQRPALIWSVAGEPFRFEGEFG